MTIKRDSVITFLVLANFLTFIVILFILKERVSCRKNLNTEVMIEDVLDTLQPNKSTFLETTTKHLSSTSSHSHLTDEDMTATGLAESGLQGTFSSRRHLGERCSPKMIARIAQNRPISQSNCPNNEKWLPFAVPGPDTQRLPRVVFIGCNKGYDFVEAARLFSWNASFSKKSVFQHHNLQDTGACQTANHPEAQIPPEKTARRIDALCVEPMPSNAKILRDAFTALKYYPQVTFLQAAVGHVHGTVPFHNGKPGTESWGIYSKVDCVSCFTDVNITFLDNILLHKLRAEDITGAKGDQSRRGTVDFLSIDTEGNDMRVLIGAIGLLMEHRVRYLEFEYHSVGKWSTSDLEDIVDLMDHFGFDCFFSGVHKLWRLTGCFDQSYRTHRHWSNVACVLRTEVQLLQKMDEIAKMSVL